MSNAHRRDEIVNGIRMFVAGGLAALFFLISILFASVGQAGGSGYLAAMALFGVSPELMRPTALTLNLLVALIGSIKYKRAGHFSGPIFWPLVITSVPMSFVGGLIHLPPHIYGPAVGILLLFSAWHLFRQSSAAPPVVQRPPSFALYATGAGIGLLSGLTGTGGGVFLGPVLLRAGWASPHQTSGVSAPFNLVNSSAALMGVLSSHVTLPAALPVWVLAAAAGGYIGAEFGSKRLDGPMIVRLLSVSLIVAAVRMLVL